MIDPKFNVKPTISNSKSNSPSRGLIWTLALFIGSAPAVSTLAQVPPETPKPASHLPGSSEPGLPDAPTPTGQSSSAPGPSGPIELPDTPSAVKSSNERWNAYMQSTYIREDSLSAAGAPYAGFNTYRPGHQRGYSFSNTEFLGLRLNKNTELYFNSETTEGTPLNRNVGIAAFPNQENFRLGDGTGPVWNYARAYIVETIPLGDKTETVESGPNQLGEQRAIKRITVIVGKFSITDFFDKNDYGGDARKSFMNWVLVNNGAYDFMSDTHGYTFGTMTELNHEHWAVRAAVITVPDNANGPNFDGKLGKAHGEQFEFEGRYKLGLHPGVVRVLTFSNQNQAATYDSLIQRLHQNPGLFYDSISAPRDGHIYTTKYGVGLNVQQQITEHAGCFGRLGWNNGKTETFAFTESDQSASAGCQSSGASWKRTKDQAGAAFFVNGLSAQHREFLAAGGYGFIIGDGKLNYAPEIGYEAFYAVHTLRNVMLTLDYQRFKNPGMNQDQKDINVYSIRLHKEFNFKDLKTKEGWKSFF